MTAPRIEVDLDAVTHNSRVLVDQLAGRGIAVTGVVKAVLGSPAIARAMLAGGVVGLGDSRVENLEALGAAGVPGPLMLTRSPMLSQVARTVATAQISLNSEPEVVTALSAAALDQGRVHDVVLMVELGDLREGLLATDVLDAARIVMALPGVRLLGLGTNLACRSGVVPDQSKMDELSRLVDQVEHACAITLEMVSGGNSANLEWALGATDTGRINHLRLGEAILLGVEPLHRTQLPGLGTEAFTLVAEVIEARPKPATPWGRAAQAAFGAPVSDPGSGSGDINQALLALGEQDVDPAGLVPPAGVRVLATSSDHLVVDASEHDLRVGSELSFGLRYGALLRAMTSPYVATSTSAAEPEAADRTVADHLTQR